MPKLCQINALLTGKKTSTEKSITEIYHKLQKPALFSGMSKKYNPKDEEGEKFPDEGQKVQVKAKDVLQDIRTAMVNLLDLTATQDVANTESKVDVKIDNKVLLAGLPPTTLLFLEKQLISLQTLLATIPVLDPSENWKYSPDAGYNVSEKTTTTKTKKTPRNHIKYEATPEHPAQVEMYFEDVVIGTFDTLRFSGAISSDERTVILGRVEKLRDAVKLAREEANSVEAKEKKVGDAIFDFILNGK